MQPYSEHERTVSIRAKTNRIDKPLIEWLLKEIEGRYHLATDKALIKRLRYERKNGCFEYITTATPRAAEIEKDLRTYISGVMDGWLLCLETFALK